MNLGDIMGLLRKKGGPFEKWGNALGEPHKESSMGYMPGAPGMAEPAYLGKEPSVFEPSKEAVDTVVQDMATCIERWMQENAVSPDDAMVMWDKVLGFLQGLGRPRLHEALDKAVHDKFISGN